MQENLPLFRRQASFRLVLGPPMTMNVSAIKITPWSLRVELNCPTVDQVHDASFNRRIELTESLSVDPPK